MPEEASNAGACRTTVCIDCCARRARLGLHVGQQVVALEMNMLVAAVQWHHDMVLSGEAIAAHRGPRLSDRMLWAVVGQHAVRRCTRDPGGTRFGSWAPRRVG